MVSNLSIAFMIFSVLLSLGFPFGLIIYMYRKKLFSFKAMGIGIIIFILFSQILESLLNRYVLLDNVGTSTLLNHQPWLYATYGAFAAGLFEEVGRYVAMRWVLVKERSWSDGISYGLGHGGMEALLIGVLGSVSSITLATMINTGKFQAMVNSTSAKSTLLALKSNLIHLPPFMFALSGLERVFALTIQLALSLIVLYGVRHQKIRFLFLAILLHAVVDFLPGLSQAAKLNIWLVEAILLVFAIIAGVFVVKSKVWFHNDRKDQPIA